jgi:O-antigen ligase
LIIGLLILPWPFMTKLQSLPRKTVLLWVAIVVCVIGGGLFASSRLIYEASFSRLTDPTEISESFGGRMAAYQDYVDAVPDVGFFGLGPGLFQLAFPYQKSPLGNVEVGLREYAHEDYFQTILEWGWLGALWWLVLIVGGLSQAYRSYSHRALFSSRTDRHLVLAAMLGVGGILAHALLDFPLQIASLRLFFYLLLALCWASPTLLSSPVASSHKRSSPRTVKAA